MGEILARALAYPYQAAPASFLLVGGEARGLEGPPELTGRRPLLCYGANAAPAILARKLAPLAELPLPVLRAELTGFDVVYSAHISPYGAVPATLQRSAATRARVFVAYPAGPQEELLTATEPNYRLHRLRGLELAVDAVDELREAHAYLSRHGCLALEGSEVALAAVASAGRTLPALEQVEVLERVRRHLAPEVELEAFVAASLDPRLASARTAALRARARPLKPP